MVWNSIERLYVPVVKSQLGSLPTSRVPLLLKAPRRVCAAVNGSSLEFKLPVHFVAKYGMAAAKAVKAMQPNRANVLLWLLKDGFWTWRFNSWATCLGILCDAISRNGRLDVVGRKEASNAECSRMLALLTTFWLHRTCLFMSAEKKRKEPSCARTHAHARSAWLASNPRSGCARWARTKISSAMASYRHVGMAPVRVAAEPSRFLKLLPE